MGTPQRQQYTPRDREGGRYTPRSREGQYDLSKMGEGAYGAPSPQGRISGGNPEGGGKSKESKFRRIIKQLKEANTTLETDYAQLKNEVTHYQVRCC